MLEGWCNGLRCQRDAERKGRRITRLKSMLAYVRADRPTEIVSAEGSVGNMYMDIVVHIAASVIRTRGAGARRNDFSVVAV